MYNDENNTYRYSRGDEGLPRDDYQPQQPMQEPVQPQYSYQQGSYEAPRYSYDPEQKPRKPQKSRTGLKITALILACALVGGACGFGGALLARRVGYGKTTIQESNRTAAEVEIQKVDGKTLMDPAEVYASTVNSVVSINSSAVSTNIFGQRVESASSGSGFIVTADGYIVTNYHVVEGASSIAVDMYNGDTYKAALVGGDPDYDLAVLKIEGKDLPVVTLGDSTKVNVGDTVLAIGNPLGELTFSQSRGSVSSANRAINVDGTPFNMIQVDASINPGNSGGPLMNLYGEVIGIVSAKYSSYANTVVEGLGFAIPISDVQAIITDIMENGQVTGKPYLAITAGTMTQEMATQYQIDLTEGVFVYSVEKDGAGAKAGLRLGDIITKVDDKEIKTMDDLSAAKKGHKAGDTVTVTYYREGQYYTTELTFDEQPLMTETEQEDTQQQQQQPNNQYPGNQYPNSQYPYGGFDMFDLYEYFFGRN
ncbi:MAG: trypsin-like peptidase domain-containing protein [Oscillospiraceae bacterium]|nr:trypsin-like peptidase domain-containing protein [Oscillospiraceae bacterium]